MKNAAAPAALFVPAPIALIRTFIAAALVLAAPGLALAQEFRKVEGQIADNVPAVPFVGIAYGVIWVAVLVYVLVVGRGLGRVNAELDELRRKLDGAGTLRK
jgi:CcmD family protein